MKILEGLVLLIVLSLHSSFAIAEISVVEKNTKQDGFNKALFLKEQWRLFEKKVNIKLDSVIVLEKSQIKGFSGLTIGSLIKYNSQLSNDVLLKVLSHELGHSFLNARCGERVVNNDLLHEAFAQWINGDYKRISTQSKLFNYRKSAINWLSRGDRSSLKNIKNDEVAIARLLSIPGKDSEIEKYFLKMLKDCPSGKYDAVGFQKILMLEPRPRKIGRVDFLLIDRISKEVVKDEGRTKTKFRVGSSLKPFLIAIDHSLMTTKISQNQLYWACPSLEDKTKIREWSWEEALAKSCNGFFLDHSFGPLFYKTFAQSTRSLNIDLGVKHPSVNQMVGLIDGVSNSSYDQVKILDWISLTNPKIIKAMRETVTIGTLSGNPEAKWFSQKGYSLKSGSVRDSKGEPLESWIIGISDRFIFAIHASGTSTAHLISDAYLKLKHYDQKAEEVKVQVLGLVPLEKLEIACSDGGKIMSSQSTNDWIFTKEKFIGLELKDKTHYTCPGSSFVMSFDSRGGDKIHRRYFGTLFLNFDKLPVLGKNNHTTERRRRARSGSYLWIKTSLHHYLQNTIISEFPNGKDEVIKALALVIKNNVKNNRHLDRPICDTTHCQVFGRGNLAPLVVKKRIERIVNSIASENLSDYDINEDWKEFSLGGEEPWKKFRNNRDLEKALGIKSQLYDVRVLGKLVEIVTQNKVTSISCEFLRNQLSLPSCPDDSNKYGEGFVFTGRGEGHGNGLDLKMANVLAAQGLTYLDLLKKFYQPTPATSF